MIEKFAEMIPNDLREISGSVFYSGRNAFTGKKKLYLLGINPGGNIEMQKKETLKWHTEKVLSEKKQNWSAYKDESWRGYAPGTHGLQPRILHLLKNLELSAYKIPASNVVFVRSSRENDIKELYNEYAEKCWDFHEKVIKDLSIKTILCFGKTPGNFVKKKLKANVLIDQFIENNNRKWKTQVFKNEKNEKVIIATHPSIADWTNIKTDPSSIIRKHLE